MAARRPYRGRIDALIRRPFAPRLLTVVTALALAASGCSAAESSPVVSKAPAPAPAPAEPVAAVGQDDGASPAVAPVTTAPATTSSTAPRPRVVTEQAWVPFAAVGGVTLRHPSSRVERVGFHESNHDGARQLETVATAVAPTVLETRERGTGSQTAADVVVDPAVELRAPVSGVVKRAGAYTLYCDNRDHYLVVEPDGHPGWEVKLLHIADVLVRSGDRVVAGETVVARGPTQLPFPSQVDEIATAQPPWPHVHIEVVDPTIPDRPTPGGGC